MSRLLLSTVLIASFMKGSNTAILIPLSWGTRPNTYSSLVEQAVYAKRKFNGLEYPPGSRLSVKYDPKEIYFDHSQQQGGQMVSNNLSTD